MWVPEAGVDGMNAWETIEDDREKITEDPFLGGL
jgi:hypothetical protein